ncbi:hypothetical protein GGR54DRAFT_601077 [Hypoxylon sp. NC1633]|nr:hypothetical protein GGR54DRAFT_601077 [Hypoxylon sp. NC1633]
MTLGATRSLLQYRPYRYLCTVLNGAALIKYLCTVPTTCITDRSNTNVEVQSVPPEPLHFIGAIRSLFQFFCISMLGVVGSAQSQGSRFLHRKSFERLVAT